MADCREEGDEPCSAHESDKGGPMRILVVEDDKDVAGFIVQGLREANHAVEYAADSRTALLLATTETFDAIVLDRMLPDGIDGLSIIQLLRSQHNPVPVLILSALAQVDDRVHGLKTGGDDYLTKPFAFSELLARVETLHRRHNADDFITASTASDPDIDLLSREVEEGRRPDIEQLHKQMLERIEVLERAMAALNAPSIGHNNPPSDIDLTEPVSQSERSELETATSILKNQPIVPGSQSAERAALFKATRLLQSLEQSVRVYLSQKGETFITEIVKAAGAETGKWAIRLTIWGAVGTALLDANRAVTVWLRALGIHL